MVKKCIKVTTKGNRDHVHNRNPDFWIRTLANTGLFCIPQCKSHRTHLTKGGEVPGGAYFQHENKEPLVLQAQLTVSWLA